MVEGRQLSDSAASWLQQKQQLLGISVLWYGMGVVPGSSAWNFLLQPLPFATCFSPVIGHDEGAWILLLMDPAYPSELLFMRRELQYFSLHSVVTVSHW